MRREIGQKPEVFHLGWEGELSRPGRVKHDGVLTIAVRQEAPQVLVMGFVFCAPTDQFDKHRGRKDAIRAMNDRPLRFRFIGNPFLTLKEVVRALCTQRFEELGHFCGEHLDYALFTTKFVPKLLKGGRGPVDVLEKVCRVPGWARRWWHHHAPLTHAEPKITIEVQKPQGLAELMVARHNLMKKAIPSELKDLLQRLRCGELGKFF